MANAPTKDTARKGEIRIMVDDTEMAAYDASNMDDDARRSFVQRLVKYADSQAMGMPKRHSL